MTANDIDSRFKYYRATDETAPKFERVRDLTAELAHALNNLAPDSREKSLALTHLEEVMFWANAAIARNGGQS